MKPVSALCAAWLFSVILAGPCQIAVTQGDEPEPLDRLTAGDQAYRAADQARRRAIGTQIEVQDYIRWRSGLPDRRWLYANPPGAAGRFSTTQPSLYGRIGPSFFGDGVFEPWAVWPGQLYGYRYDNPVEQPVGDEIRPTGPNGYTYGPVYDRSPPVHGPPPPQAYAPGSVEEVAVEADPLDAAIGAFRSGRYQESLDEIDEALSLRPEDGAAGLLRVQSGFALGDYEAAAADLRRVLPELPEKHWGRIVRDYRRIYPAGGTFRDQLRRLEGHLDERPDDVDARALLAYEYAYLGHPKPAVAQLEQALDAAPRDRLLRRMREVFAAMIVAPEPEERAGPRKF